MGVSGCGKTTIGRSLAEKLSARFVEGDSFHPDSNVAKMAGGTPLTEADRAPWLAAIRNEIELAIKEDESLIVACSALTRRSRDALGHAENQIKFVFLNAPRDAIAARLASREGHFMPQILLDSQFETLEMPTAEEATHVDALLPAEDLVAEIIERI